MPRKIAAGNWKMNGLGAALDELDAIAESMPRTGCEVLIAPPFTLIAQAAGRGVAVAGQDCHAAESGAHTGDVSAAMLRDAGAVAVILGHSERRTDHGETDEVVAAKARAAREAGLTAIVCIGETLQQRQAGEALDVVRTQLAGSVPDGATPENTVVAYEPVWAIGTGEVATPDQIAEVHAALREALPDPEIAILYGGSVKAANAAEIFATPNVDGALVGGASLKAQDFLPICKALAEA